jgi:hypothetical protein
MRIASTKDAARPKPQFKINIRPKADAIPLPWSLWSEPFRKLVMDALEASRQVDEMGAPENSKLSRDAFLRQTLKCSSSATIKSVEALQRKLASGDPGFDYSRAALRKMEKELQGPNLRTPPTADKWETRSRAMFLRPRVTEVISELAAVGFTPLDLFGVAILQAPASAFGNADLTQADLDGGIAAAIKKRDELFVLIGIRWTADDVDAGAYRQGQTTAAVFKGTPVFVAPTDTAGRRLIQHLDSGAKLVAALTRGNQ